MERRELERPSSGEAYVDWGGNKCNKRGLDLETMRAFGDSLSAPVRPLKVGFGVKNEKA